MFSTLTNVSLVLVMCEKVSLGSELWFCEGKECVLMTGEVINL